MHTTQLPRGSMAAGLQPSAPQLFKQHAPRHVCAHSYPENSTSRPSQGRKGLQLGVDVAPQVSSSATTPWAAPAPADLRRQQQREAGRNALFFAPPTLQPTRPQHPLTQPSQHTAPALLQPPAPLPTQLAQLSAMKRDLSRFASLSKKVERLASYSSVRAFLQASWNKPLVKCLQQMGLQEQYVLLCLPAMGQQHVLSQPAGALGRGRSTANVADALSELAGLLQRVEHFYDSIGGLVGYQAKSLELILEGSEQQQQQQHQQQQQEQQMALAGSIQQGAQETQVQYHVPHALDLAGENSRELGEQVASHGLMALPRMAEIYPVGGAGDRLGLECEDTGECLPAAMLPYSGRTMLESLVRDLQAREYLYYKLTGKQVITPVAIMTSDAKGNHQRMMQLMESLNWFGRGRESFRLFRQPLVPVISVEDGQWLLSSPMQVMAKPGGHGAIWKLMRDEGIFAWLQELGREAALVRQISNPMAGTDSTLLALAGRGQQQGGSFGFMSCDRAVGAAEGCNALQERRTWEGGAWRYEYGYTNIEYTEFGRLGMSDLPTEQGAATSKFPANTNVLYVNLHDALGVVEQAVEAGSSEQLMPGLIFNRKKAVSYHDPLKGTTNPKLLAGRMECTMQNIADFMTDRKPEPLQPQDPACNQLSTFLVYNERRKVTSSAKKRREPGSTKISQTPDGSFYDLQRNAQHLLHLCGVSTPPMVSVEQYLQSGLGFLFLYHPSLGPLWDVISQKVRGGQLHPGAEMVLEVAEACLENVSVEGSLLVYADNVMGHRQASTDAAALHSQEQQQNPHARSSSSSSSSSSSRRSSRDGSSSSSSSNSSVLNNISSGSNLLSGSSKSSSSSVPRLSPRPSHFPPVDAPSTHSSPRAPHALPVHGGSPGVHSSNSSGSGGVEEARLMYSDSSSGRVRMHNVRVQNRGVDWQSPDNVYWKHQVARSEAVRVHLQGRSEFEARDVTIQGSQDFEVPEGCRMVISQGPAGGIEVCVTPLDVHRPTWQWHHSLDTATGRVQLQLVEAGGGC